MRRLLVFLELVRAVILIALADYGLQKRRPNSRGPQKGQKGQNGQIDCNRPR